MRPHPRGVLAALLATAALGAVAQTPAPALPLLPPARAIDGVSQEDWSKRWWRWALSFDEGEGPLDDADGRRCGFGQQGPVWFLAGGFDPARTVRHCRVPAGRTLFFPLVNVLAMEPEDEDESCASLKRRAAAQTPGSAGLLLDVNGRRHKGLAAHRQATRRCFHVFEDDETRAAGNGFYVALGPLKKGRYTLNFGGVLPGLSQAVTYTLEVD